MIKLFVSDVDDTLLRTKLSEELKDSIKAANENGVEFVLCSGRPTFNLIKLAKELNEHGASINYVAGFNGSEIIDINTGETVRSRGFEASEVDEITEFLKEIEMNYGLYEGSNVVTHQIEEEYAKYEAMLNDMGVIFHETSIPSNKILGFIKEHLADEKLELITNKFPELQVNKSKPFFIEITKPGVNKGLAVNEVSELLNIDLTNIAICGDGDNDLAMYDLDVARKYVVANGSDKLKAKADKILASVDECGVGRELMELIK